MNVSEIYQFMNQNPVFFLATEDKDQPRVRGMLLYRADENGIIFHTATIKDVYKQIKGNPKVELCFFANGTQVRVSGVLEEANDEGVKEEICAHPSRKFMQAWKDAGLNVPMSVFILKNASAVTWTFADNFKPKNPIRL